jgi:hypothetical protein
MDHETVKFSLSLPDEEIELVVPKLRLKPRRYIHETDLKPGQCAYDPLGWPISPSDFGPESDDTTRH